MCSLMVMAFEGASLAESEWFALRFPAAFTAGGSVRKKAAAQIGNSPAAIKRPVIT